MDSGNVACGNNDTRSSVANSVNDSKLSHEFYKMLSAESQNLIQRFQRLPLREMKILFMLAGEIIAHTDNNLELNEVPDEHPEKFLKSEDLQTNENLDIELFERLGNVVRDVRDISSTANQLLTHCESQEQIIKGMTTANSHTRTLAPTYSAPISAQISGVAAAVPGNHSTSISTSWMNFSRNPISNTNTPRKTNGAEKNVNIGFISSSYFTTPSKPTTPASVNAGNNPTNTGSLAQKQATTTKPSLPQQRQANPYPVLTQSPYTLPSLEFFMAQQSKPISKRRGKSGTFAELCNKPKNGLITSYITTEFKSSPKPKLVKPNPHEVEEFNDMFVEEAKPEEAGPNTGAGASA